MSELTGFVKYLDDYNRVDIPRGIIEHLYGTRFATGKRVEVSLTADSTIVLKPYKEPSEWKPVKVGSNKAKKFACECGYISTCATNYCGNCGSKKQNVGLGN